MDRAEERAGPEDVGDQALMRGLDTALPFVRPGLSLSEIGRRSCDRPRSKLGSSPCRGPALASARLMFDDAVLAEIGDLSRFQNPRELMGYLGLVPSESSTGDKVKRGGITKAGNGRARRILVEAAWSYRYPPRVSREKQPKVQAAPRRVREIAGKAQTRLCGRFRSLERQGKRRTVVATAIARELSAFIWAINRELMAHRQA